MPTGSRSAAIGRAIGCMLLPLALPALLAGCGTLRQVGAGTHHPPATTFTVSARVSTLVINGGAGGITVTGSGRRTIAVSQQPSYSATPPATARALSGSTLTLSYTCPAQLVCGVTYDIQVPRGVAVRAVAHAGAISLTSLAGPVSAQTTAGLITANGLTSASAELRSSAGGIDASFTTAPGSVLASTKVGPISLAVPGSAAYRIDTHTVVGTSSVTVPRSAASAHVISASSDLGSITVGPS